MKKLLITFSALALVVTLGLGGGKASAHHAWSNYHWARGKNPVYLQIVNNLSPIYQSAFNNAVYVWNYPPVVATKAVVGKEDPVVCPPKPGMVEVCSAPYGANDWEGQTEIWTTKDNHITSGVVMINDTNMLSPESNNESERNHVLCQEIGHTLGLDHQDESGASLQTCMDYSSSPDSQTPNAHDYEELDAIYKHIDNFGTVAPPMPTNSQLKALRVNRDLGKQTHKSAKVEIYQKILGDNNRVTTIVNKK